RAGVTAGHRAGERPRERPVHGPQPGDQCELARTVIVVQEAPADVPVDDDLDVARVGDECERLLHERVQRDETTPRGRPAYAGLGSVRPPDIGRTGVDYDADGPVQLAGQLALTEERGRALLEGQQVEPPPRLGDDLPATIVAGVWIGAGGHAHDVHIHTGHRIVRS